MKEMEWHSIRNERSEITLAENSVEIVTEEKRTKIVRQKIDLEIHYIDLKFRKRLMQ